MSSSDEEVLSLELGALSSKDRAPVTPIGSKSDGDDVVKRRTLSTSVLELNRIGFFQLPRDLMMKWTMIKENQDIRHC